ncbi:hypothetical protein ACFLQ0_05200 [Nitrospinota bacterium]
MKPASRGRILHHAAAHPEGEGTPGGNRAFDFCDPDGHRIEILPEMAGMNDQTNGIEPKWFSRPPPEGRARPIEIPARASLSGRKRLSAPPAAAASSQ